MTHNVRLIAAVLAIGSLSGGTGAFDQVNLGVNKKICLNPPTCDQLIYFDGSSILLTQGGIRSAELYAGNAYFATQLFVRSANSIINDVGELTLSGTPGITLQAPMSASSALNAGQIALTSGTPSTATVTVRSGAHCVCTETATAAGNATLKCNVSGTTLTITGGTTITDTIAYVCF